jgi:hypothetical protein
MRWLSVVFLSFALPAQAVLAGFQADIKNIFSQDVNTLDCVELKVA